MRKNKPLAKPAASLASRAAASDITAIGGFSNVYENGFPNSVFTMANTGAVLKMLEDESTFPGGGADLASLSTYVIVEKNDGLAIIERFKRNAPCVSSHDMETYAYSGDAIGKFHGGILHLNYSTTKNYVEVHITAIAEHDKVNSAIAAAIAMFADAKQVEGGMRVLWKYDSGGSVMNRWFQSNPQGKLFDTSYPYLPCPVDEYINTYLDAEEPVLLLLGEPGTGKTRFIRRLMTLMGERDGNMAAIYTTDRSIVSQSDMFVEFLGDTEYALLVVEDMDEELRERETGNRAMYNLLGSSDGIVSTNGKKIVLSTNLPNMNHIDGALLRPGRCYDAVAFRALGGLEIEHAWRSIEPDKPCSLHASRATLAELYAAIREKRESGAKELSRRCGFRG